MRTGKNARNTSKPRFSKPVGDPRDARGLYAAMRRFIEHRAVLGATDVALFNLEQVLRYFIEWADSRSVTHPEQVTLSILERYQRWLYHYRKQDGAPLSLATQRVRLSSLRALFKWLTRTGQLPANPAAELDLPRRVRRVPRSVLTAEEVEQVLALADTSDMIGLRDRAIMEVLYSTGMRRMEIAHLEIGDIDVARCVVLIREGKGRKDRLLPLGERALHWVQQYLEHSREQLVWDQQEMALFLGIEGLPLSAAWLSYVVAQYVKRAELGKRGACHMFRHTMATLMLEGGADIRFIQAMLGHADLSTTQIYTQVVVKQLQQVHAQTHPGANRRVRGVQEGESVGSEQADDENTAEALFAALAQEADEEEEA